MNSTLNAKEVNQGQNHTAEQVWQLPREYTREKAQLQGSRGKFSDRSQSRDHYRLPSRSNRCSSTPYYNTHYHQGNLSTLHISSLKTTHIPKEGTLETRWSDNILYYPSFQNQFITNHSQSQDKYRCTSMHNFSNTKLTAMAPSPKMYNCLWRRHE